MFRSPCDKPRSVRCVASAPRGLTLIELVVVLVILTALTGLAVRSLEPIADQSRFESSQQTLQNAGGAIFDRVDDGDRVVYSGFVTDIGRLPLSVGTDAERFASELWDNAGGLPGFTLEPFNDPDTTEDESIRTENQILVGAGWRGPYLQLPPGSDVLRDGYGNAIASLDAAGAQITAAGVPIAGLRSFGSNGLESAMDTGYARDLSLPEGTIDPADYEGALSVMVRASDGVSDPALTGSQRLVVRVFGPTNGVASELDELEADTGNSFQVEFTDVLAGVRAVRAVVVDGSPPSETIAGGDVVRYVTIHPGQLTPLEIRLP